MASPALTTAVLMAAAHHAAISRLMDEMNSITPRTDNEARIGNLATEIQTLADGFGRAIQTVIVQAEKEACAREDAWIAAMQAGRRGAVVFGVFGGGR